MENLRVEPKHLDRPLEARCCIGREPTAISTAQALAPNDVKITRWQCPYLSFSGFASVQWEEAEAGHPSLYTVYGVVLIYSSKFPPENEYMYCMS